MGVEEIFTTRAQEFANDPKQTYRRSEQPFEVTFDAGVVNVVGKLARIRGAGGGALAEHKI